nr:hypothetical protein [Tanacetum cinerariifolium]
APSPIASPVATPTATISINEDQFLEVGAQLELHGSILHDHTQRLDTLPPTLFADIDRDVRELYTRSGMVRDEIFSQRQAQLVDTYTELDLEEAPLEANESQLSGFKVPFEGEEFDAFELLGTRTDSSHSSAPSDFTTPLSPSHPLTHVSPTPTPTRASLHRRTALRKRYRGTSELIFDTDSEGDELEDEDTDEDEEDESLDADYEREGLDDKGHGLDDEGRSLDDEVVGESLGLGYGALRRRELAVKEDEVLSTFEVGQSSRSVSEQHGAERVFALRKPTLVAPSPIASPVATPTATISINEDQFLEVGAQLELHGSILHDHTQRLDTLPPTLFADIDRDVRELYTRSGMVRDEIFS